MEGDSGKVVITSAQRNACLKKTLSYNNLTV